MMNQRILQLVVLAVLLGFNFSALAQDKEVKPLSLSRITQINTDMKQSEALVEEANTVSVSMQSETLFVGIASLSELDSKAHTKYSVINDLGVCQINFKINKWLVKPSNDKLLSKKNQFMHSFPAIARSLNSEMIVESMVKNKYLTIGSLNGKRIGKIYHLVRVDKDDIKNIVLRENKHCKKLVAYGKLQSKEKLVKIVNDIKSSEHLTYIAAAYYHSLFLENIEKRELSFKLQAIMHAHVISEGTTIRFKAFSYSLLRNMQSYASFELPQEHNINMCKDVLRVVASHPSDEIIILYLDYLGERFNSITPSQYKNELHGLTKVITDWAKIHNNETVRNICQDLVNNYQSVLFSQQKANTKQN